jgi:hypothetical protein
VRSAARSQSAAPIGLRQRAERLRARLQERDLAVGRARRQRGVDLGHHLGRFGALGQRAAQRAGRAVRVSGRLAAARELEQHRAAFAAERAGREPALDRRDAEAALAHQIRDRERRSSELGIARSEDIEGAPGKRRGPSRCEASQPLDRGRDVARGGREPLGLGQEPRERVGELHAVVAPDGASEAGARGIQIAGTQGPCALSPGGREERLVQVVEDRGEGARERRPRHDDAHRALDRFGAPAARGAHADLGASRGGTRERRIGVARLLARHARAVHVACAELLLGRDGEQHRAQRGWQLPRDATERERAGPLLTELRGEQQREAVGGTVGPGLRQHRQELAERGRRLPAPPIQRGEREPHPRALDTRGRLVRHRGQERLELRLPPESPEHALERHRVTTLLGLELDELMEYLDVSVRFVGSTGQGCGDAAERRSPSGALDTDELGPRLLQRLVLQPRAWQEPHHRRAYLLALRGERAEARGRPSREARVAEPLFREHDELAQAVDALGVHAGHLLLPHANQRLHERPRVARHDRMTAQRLERRLAPGVGRQRVDPGVDRAIRTSERPGVKPPERHASARPLATREKIRRDLDARRQELVHPRALEQAVDPERRLLRAVHGLERGEHAAKVDLRVEPRVERRTERSRQIAVLHRLAHATQVRRARAVAEGRRVLAPDLVRGSAAPAREQRARESLRRRRVARTELERAHQRLERRRPVSACLAPLGRGEVRVRRARWLERVRCPGTERRLDLERHRIGGIRQRRIGERVARRACLTGAREQHTHAHEQRRRLGPAALGDQGPQGRRGERRLSQRDEPTRELLAQDRIFSQEQRAPGQARRHVELGTARGERASQGGRCRPLGSVVAARVLDLGE